MATKILDMERGQLVIRPEVLGIPSFQAIWNDDKSEDKAKATKILTYIYYLVDFHSPYAVHAPHTREEILNRDFFGGKAPKEAKILGAIKAYQEFHQTTSMYLLEKSKLAARKLADYFNDINFYERDEKGQPLYKATDVTRNLKEVGNIIDSLTKVENKVKKEVQESSHVRGGGSVGHFED